MSSTRRLAMLIDGDNAQPSLITEMLAEANKYGVITIRRIYGDWTEPNMNSWKETLRIHAIQPIQQFRNTTGKNATDSALIIDAMDILYTAGVDGLCLVSSDSDFTRLATRIRESNLFVMGIGKRNTPISLVNACDVFVYTETLQAESASDSSAATAEPKSKSAEPNTSTKTDSPVGTSRSKNNQESALHQLFRKAFNAAVMDDGWATVADLGNKLRQLDPAFDPRTHGHRGLQSLVQAHADVFEVSKNSKDAAIVRLKENTEATRQKTRRKTPTKK